MDLNRLSRNYETTPLGVREPIPKEDLEYLYIELNYCFREIAWIMHKSENTISRYCKKYGLLKSHELHKKSMEDYYLRTIGVRNPALLPSSQEKMKKTMLERYGVENIAYSKDKQEKKKQTCLEKYGVDNVAKSDFVKEKSKKTNLEKYGKEHHTQSEEVKAKKDKTMLERYGCLVPLQNKDIKKKQEETCLERYGTKNPFQNKSIQNKQKETVKEKYGVDNVAQNHKIITKVILTKKLKGNFNTSLAETEIQKLLFKIFPKVQVQYNLDERYPYNCDFYVPEMDLFIEYQGFISHGNQPYGLDAVYDEKLLQKWWKKVELFQKDNPTKPLYDCAYYNYIMTWAVSDPLKRQIAKENNLNWIEFFNMEDFMEWYKGICETLN